MGIWIRRATIGGAMVGVFAVFPSRMRSPEPSPETQAIASLMVIRSAEIARAATTNGRYDTLADLAAGGFLTSELALAQPSHGYRFQFYPGGSAMTSYAVVATPANPGKSSLAFCIDADGRIFRSPANVVPAVEGGRCVDRSHPLQ